MCERMGDEVDPKKLPPELKDFPSYVVIAIDIFNALPDTYSGGMSSVYAGKDLSALDTLLRLFKVSEDETMLVFNTIGFLDTRARKQAMREAEKANKKLSRN